MRDAIANLDRFIVTPALSKHRTFTWMQEPTLARKFGEPYAAYRRAVPGWLPRVRPWRG